MLANPDEVRHDTRFGREGYAFIKKYDKYHTLVVDALFQDGKLVLYKTFFGQQRRPYGNMSLVWPHSVSVGGGRLDLHPESSPVSRTVETAPGSSLPALTDKNSIAPSDQNVKSEDVPRYNRASAAYQQAATAVRDAKDKVDRFTDKSAFVKQDIKPAAKAAGEGLKAAFDGVLSAVNPMHRDAQAEEAGRLIINGMGRTAMEKEKFIGSLNRAAMQGGAATSKMAKAIDLLQSSHTLADKVFNTMPEADRWEAVRRYQRGEAQSTPELKHIFDAVQQMFDTKAAAVRATGTGALQKLIENYFPGMWEKSDAAGKDIAMKLSKRPLEGSKSFLKAKVFDDVMEGINLGYKPISANPLDLVFLKMDEMDKYINAHTVLNELKAQGLKVFVRNGAKAPEGYVPINDRYGTVWGPGMVKGNEHVDKSVYEGLTAVADALGVVHQRQANAGKGALGYSMQNGNKIVTQHNTETSVLAHEIGHQIDSKYGLREKIVKEAEGIGKRGVPTKNANSQARRIMAEELRAIADETGGRPGNRKRVEQVAQMVEIYSHAPELMRQVAPNVFKAFDKLVRNTPELSGLADIAPGIELKAIKYSIKTAGPMLMGRYYVPEGVGQVFNNYLSQSLYHNQYVGKPYTAYMKTANALNQFQLGVFSAFHAGFTSHEVVISHAALGIKALARGDFKAAGKFFLTAPGEVYNNPKRGNEIVNALTGNAAATPEMAQTISWLEMAGARRLMDTRFYGDSTQKMFQSWADGNKVGAALRGIPAIVEQSARPILEWLVPRQKFGVFSEMAHEWSRLNPQATHEATRKEMQQIWNRVDSRMGQVVYDRLFAHNVSKNIIQALVRAPGWTGGTILEVRGGFKDLAAYAKSGGKSELTDRAAYTLSLLATTALMNAALTALFTGEPPDDWKDMLAFRTGNKDERGNPERFMLPTYMKDLYAYAQAPGTTLLHKAHPLLSLIGDVARNKDYYGTEIRHEGDNPFMQMAQAAGFTAGAFVPFWMKGVQKERERQGSALATMLPSIGVMPAPADLNKTAAESLASKLQQDRMPVGSKTDAEFERSKLVRRLTSQVRRDGATGTAAVQQAVRARSITPLQAHHIQANARLAPIQVAVKSLAYDEALKVWEVSNQDERKKLRLMMAAKRHRYLQNNPGVAL